MSAQQSVMRGPPACVFARFLRACVLTLAGLIGVLTVVRFISCMDNKLATCKFINSRGCDMCYQPIMGARPARCQIAHTSKE